MTATAVELTPEGVAAEPPLRVAGIFLTRRCNLACGYCRVIRRKCEPELTVPEWKRAFTILDRLGITKVAVLGGEPTVVSGIDEIVSHVVTTTSLDLLLLSNSMASRSVLKRIVDAGLKRYSTSVDSIEDICIDPDSWRKSSRALETLVQMREWGVPNLTAYVVVNRQNLAHVPVLAKHLSEQGIWLYTLPLHWGHEDFWENRAISGLPISFQQSDLPAIKEMAGRLQEMKADGYLIANTEQYLADWVNYMVRLNWHCRPTASELRIDADGALMCCNDIRGQHSERYSVFDLPERDRYIAFQLERAQDAAICPGCFWPSHYHAERVRWTEISVTAAFVRS